MKPEAFLIETKYHPKTPEDVIFPKRMLNFLNGVVKSQNILNYVFKGGAGSGKTTVAEMLGKELDMETTVVAGSVDNGIDYIRGLEDLANTATSNGNNRLIIIDEADYLSKNAQAGLRNVINRTMDSCRYILTCNYPEKIIPALKDSRTPIVDFDYTPEEINEMSTAMWKRILFIASEEGWTIESKKSLASFMMKNLPNIRFILKKLQMLASDNENRIPESIDVVDERLSIASLKNYVLSDYETLRKFVSRTPQDVIMTFIFEHMEEISSDPEVQMQIITWCAYYQGQQKGIEDVYTVALLTNLRGVFEKKK